MDFYHVKDAYIKYLREYDVKIPDNKNELRPFVGIVLSIKKIQYYVPLTSPKEKHRHMKNTLDFRKIHGGQYGALNFNNMIPVPEEELSVINISEILDLQYKRLLQNQYKEIKNEWTAIKANANRLYRMVSSANPPLYIEKIKKRCCDWKRLEEACMRYNNTKL